jgi:hypothetical protein
MPPRTQRSLLEDEQKRVKANAALLSGNNQAPRLSAPTQAIEDRLSGASPEDAQKVRRNLLDAAGGTQSDENFDVVPGSAGFSMRSKHFDPATKAKFSTQSVQEAIDPRGRTEILQAGNIDFSQNRGGGLLNTGVSAEDALAVLRGNKPPQPDFAVRGTGIPALPDDIAQRRSDFAERSAAAIGGGSREDRAKRLTEIRRPAVEAAATEAAAATLDATRKHELDLAGEPNRVKGEGELSLQKAQAEAAKELAESANKAAADKLRSEGMDFTPDANGKLPAETSARLADMGQRNLDAIHAKATAEGNTELAKTAINAKANLVFEQIGRIQAEEGLTPRAILGAIERAVASFDPPTALPETSPPETSTIKVPETQGSVQGDLDGSGTVDEFEARYNAKKLQVDNKDFVQSLSALEQADLKDEFRALEAERKNRS